MVSIRHATLTTELAPDTKISDSEWDAEHDITGLAAGDVSGLAPIATSGSAADLSAGTVPAARMPALTGDVTTSAGAVATTLATVNGNVGSFGSATAIPVLTVNAKGLVTAVSTATPLVNGSTWSGQDLAVADGGTGASTASAARTNLGLVIGTDVEAFAALGTTSQYWRGDKSWQTLNGLAIANTPAGNISAVTVQAAIDELDTEKQPVDATLTAFAGLSWSAGSQVPVMTAADTVGLRSIGAAGATDILDRAAGDARYALSATGVSDGDKGDITVSSSGTVWTVDDDAITYAKMQNVSATDKVLGRSTAGSGDVEEIACTAGGRAVIGLTYAADKVAYSTSASAAATTDLTSVARTLIGQTTQALMRTTGLGLGTSATIDTGTSGTKVALLDGVNTWSGAQTFSAIPVLSGGGVKFPATQAASADANTLDDYEEGSFTPALTFGGGSTGMTFAQQNGRYTKVGNLVTVGVLLSFTAKGSSTGTAEISGLPFTASATVIQGCGAMFATNLTTVAMPMSRIVHSTAVISLYDFTGSSAAVLTHADFTDTSQLAITISYWV